MAVSYLIFKPQFRFLKELKRFLIYSIVHRTLVSIFSQVEDILKTILVKLG